VGAHREWWNGDGFPEGLAQQAIPLAARVLAAADELVGSPASGFLPSWDHGRKRVASAAGTALDPSIAQLVANIALDDIEAPLIPSTTVSAQLNDTRGSASDDPDDPASTIKTAVTSAADTDEVMALFARTARDAVDAREVIILTSSATEFNPEPLARATRGDLSAPAASNVFEFAVQAELRAGVSIEHCSLDSGHIDTILAPMFTRDQCWGAIVARRADTESAFEASDLEALGHIATEAGAALTRTNHWAELERMALYDQLTGLANRHELYRILDDIFERPAMDRLDTALIMCDVDGLKVVNDTLGHQAGDRLLIDAAASLRGAVRDVSRTTVCRIGGDEFCLVIDGGGLLTAHDVSESIERLFARSGGSNETRSISCGIAFATEDIASRSALLRAADENQYETKRARKAERAEEAQQVDLGDRPVVDRRAIRD